MFAEIGGPDAPPVDEIILESEFDMLGICVKSFKRLFLENDF